MQGSIRIFKFTIIWVVLAILLCACSSEKNNSSGSEVSSITIPDFEEVKEPQKGITEEDFAVNKSDLKSNEKSWETINEWFIDENGTEYLFDRKTGKLSGISKLYVENQPEQSINNVDQMAATADAIIARLAGANEYKWTHFYAEDIRTNYFYYARIEDGYKTTEGGFVSICNSGHVIHAEVVFVGLFDDVKVPPINEKELDNSFVIAANQQFGNIGTDYEILERVLDYKDGELFMRYEFEYTTEEGYGVREQIEVPV